jgi:aminoglycoside phosphotransferase (APT) family kinase protein
VSTSATQDVVRTVREAAAQEREPLVVIEPLEAFLDAAGLGDGPLTVAPIGDGHSNVTYALSRGDLRLVLRRPPRGPLPPSAHDVLREAKLLSALGPAGVRVPEVLATCDDGTVIGAPFYLMPLIDGHVLTRRLPADLDAAGRRRQIGEEVVDALIELHAVDVQAAGLSDFGRPGAYLERQLRRFRGLLERNATRPLPELERVAELLSSDIPATATTTVVHGDYRLGNVMFAPGAPTRLSAMLDWELAALGDPLADLGYLTATWAEPGDPPNPMLDLSAVTRLPGFLDRHALARRYAERTGRDLAALGWYQALALWKAAIFLEGSYQRHLAGSTDDPYFARLGDGVPALAGAARAAIDGAHG